MKVHGPNTVIVGIRSYEEIILEIINARFAREETNTNPVELFGMKANAFDFVGLYCLSYLHVKL